MLCNSPAVKKVKQHEEVHAQRIVICRRGNFYVYIGDLFLTRIIIAPTMKCNMQFLVVQIGFCTQK